MPATLRIGRTADLDPFALYKILQLRADVFVVEQRCVYADLDGRDLENGTRHVWAEQDGRVLSTLRMLDEPDGTIRIGRVATAPAARATGLARRLMALALEHAADRTVVLDAQSYLVGWYATLGFAPSGPEFVEDGIAHTPMRREPSRAG